MRIIYSTSQKGYTLIELLLYISILGSLLTGISLYFVTATTARVKNQSIAEVDRQGTLVMDYITQTIRNANSITSPTAGSTANGLTLAVPTAPLSPTIFNLDGGGTAVLGYNQVGGFGSEFNGSSINATKIVASVSGSVSTLYSNIGVVGPSGSDKGQMAIYSGTSNPSALLGKSATVTMTPNAWNAFTIPTVNITAGETYWLAYNTVDLNNNNLWYRSGAAGQSMTVGQSYGTWPNSWTGSNLSIEYSMYANVVTAGSSGGTIQVKEGAAAVLPLTNDKVEISNLSFKNLSRPGTPGIVQVSFTISRVNVGNRNEYDYQKTYTASAALRP